MTRTSRFGRLRTGRVLVLTACACAAAFADTASFPDTIRRAADSSYLSVDTAVTNPVDSGVTPVPPDTTEAVDTAGVSDTTSLVAPPVVPSGPRPWREETDSLLAFVGGLHDAVFIRNGSEYSAAQAVAHLRLKWTRQDGRIRSTEDFILQCATRSSFTGRVYQVRFADGTVRPAAEVLRDELRRLRGHDARATR